MRTKDFCAAIEAGFEAAYDHTTFHTVPYVDKDTKQCTECLGILLHKSEHFAIVVAHAAKWIATDPDNVFEHDGDPDLGEAEHIMDTLEDFMNLVSGMHVAPFMQWTCVYFPGLTEEQVLGSQEAGHDPQLVTDTAVGRDPIDGTMPLIETADEPRQDPMTAEFPINPNPTREE